MYSPSSIRRHRLFAHHQTICLLVSFVEYKVQTSPKWIIGCIYCFLKFNDIRRYFLLNFFIFMSGWEAERTFEDINKKKEYETNRKEKFFQQEFFVCCVHFTPSLKNQPFVIAWTIFVNKHKQKHIIFIVCLCARGRAVSFSMLWRSKLFIRSSSLEHGKLHVAFVAIVSSNVCKHTFEH